MSYRYNGWQRVAAAIVSAALFGLGAPCLFPLITSLFLSVIGNRGPHDGQMMGAAMLGLLAAPVAAIAGAALSMHLTRPKPDPMRCSACGHDLSGSPGPACPECGGLLSERAG